jgi:hypothetical protein
MASTKKKVTLRGTSSGQGINVACLVSAIEVTNSATKRVTYISRHVQSVDTVLPDGVYALRCSTPKMMMTSTLKHEQRKWRFV